MIFNAYHANASNIETCYCIVMPPVVTWHL